MVQVPAHHAVWKIFEKNEEVVLHEQQQVTGRPRLEVMLP